MHFFRFAEIIRMFDRYKNGGAFIRRAAILVSGAATMGCISLPMMVSFRAETAR
jgi:hypothetical protein